MHVSSVLLPNFLKKTHHSFFYHDFKIQVESSLFFFFKLIVFITIFINKCKI